MLCYAVLDVVTYTSEEPAGWSALSFLTPLLTSLLHDLQLEMEAAFPSEVLVTLC